MIRFLGSGTSLIAAEMTGRACYGLELDPAYVDVIGADSEDRDPSGAASG
jgi:DNA modification methylase